MNHLTGELYVKYSCLLCWLSEKRHEVSGEEKEKEDISRLDGDDDIKVRRGGPGNPHRPFTGGISQMMLMIVRL